MPSIWPSTLTRVLSGTLAKCRRVPSAIFTMRSLPLTATTVPFSTVTWFVACPAEVDVSVCTCALPLVAKVRQTAPTVSTRRRCIDVYLRFIVYSPFLAFGTMEPEPFWRFFGFFGFPFFFIFQTMRFRWYSRQYFAHQRAMHERCIFLEHCRRNKTDSKSRASKKNAIAGPEPIRRLDPLS